MHTQCAHDAAARIHVILIRCVVRVFADSRNASIISIATEASGSAGFIVCIIIVVEYDTSLDNRCDDVR
jgi:hypothetical protein